MRCCVAALWVSALTSLAVAADDSRPEAPAHPVENEVELTDEEKRAWSSLTGGWGKRGWQDLNSAWGKRAWQDLNAAWGKRGWQDLNSAWGKRGWQDLNSAWGKRAWRDMYQSPWGKRGWQDMSSAWGKRGWQDMSSAWGKRGWQDMSSAWGKRAPEKWANFHGSWGKRSEPGLLDYPNYEPTLEQLSALQLLESERPELMEMAMPEKKAWSSLHGTWGKRPVKPAPMNSGSYYWKRQPGWTNLRGMWGKRSAEIPAYEDNDDHESSSTPDEA